MSLPSIEDKVVIVTGGAQGMGRALVLGFARAGAEGVVFIDRCDRALGRQVVSDARKITGDRRVIFIPGDVTKPADCKRTVDRTIKAFGRVDVLINNAALGERATGSDRLNFWKFDDAGWKALMDVNVNGPFHMTKAVVPAMIRRKWGRIINLTKARESMHEPLISAYGSSKAALEAMSIAWAVELLRTGVTINSISPGGPVDTDFMTPSRRRLARSNGRILQPDVIVPMALWLASDRSRGITGCRFIARRFNERRPSRKAAEYARDPAIFLPPRRRSDLSLTWKVPVGQRGVGER